MSKQERTNNSTNPNRMGDPTRGSRSLAARSNRGRSGGGGNRGGGNRGGGRGRGGDKTAQAPAATADETPAAAAPGESQEKLKIEIPEVISVRDLAQAMGTNAIEIIKTLMSYGTMANINELVDFDTAAIVGEELGIEVQRETIAEPETEPGVEAPKTLRERLIEMEDDPDKLAPRPPVVTVLGHVDHGKTTLLDAIRDTDVVAGESGGITQHIGAHQVRLGDNRVITFLDTPGHAAFTAMRSRGAQATDIAILVVAADDGVMPQTREAIAHVRAARVPIIVALNKIDKSNANPDRVKQQLSELGLQPEEWGGETPLVELSAKQRLNIDELLENVLLVAEIMNLQANPEGVAIGTVIEANQDRRLGNVATVLVQKGSLHVGDALVVGQEWGRVRAMFDNQGNNVEVATPSMPVQVTGLQGVPGAGDIFQVVESDRLARQISAERSEKARETTQEPRTLSLDDLYAQIQSGEMKELNLIIKADVQGSLEPIVNSLQDLSTDEVSIRILHQDVGAVTESDVMLAAASRALILGFHTRADVVARRQAEQQGVSIQLYDVIYNLVDDVSKAMKGMLEPVYEERVIGTAEVRAIFHIRGRGSILGCMVREGEIHRDAIAVALRDGKEIYRGRISSLKRYQEDVTEVRAGYECGIGIDGFNHPEEGDLVRALERVRVR